MLDHLKSRGWKPWGRRTLSEQRRRPPAQAALIYHLWDCLLQARAVHTEVGLYGWLEKNTKSEDPRRQGWQRPEFLPDDVAPKVVEMLKKWAGRLNIDWANPPPQPEEENRK